jgi:hypothetical protein
MSDRIGVNETVSLRLVRGGGRMETKEINIEGKTFKLQRLGNLTMLSYMGAGEASAVMGKLIQNTVIEPVFKADEIETLEPIIFAKLLEEVLLINNYANFVASMNMLSNSMAKVIPNTNPKVNNSAYVK